MWSTVLGSLVMFAAAAAMIGAAYAVACALLPERGGSLRLASAAVLSYVIFALAFLCLGLSGVLTTWAFAVILAACALGLFRTRQRVLDCLVEDRAAADEWWNVLRERPWRWLAYLAAALAAFRFVRALALPPLATDSLTYHLFRAAQWVQAGGIVHEAAPDAWGYYDCYPTVGDGLWALAMLGPHSATWLGLAEGLVFCTLLLGGYATARALGIDRARSTVASLAIGFVPSVFVFSSSGYVDGTVLAAFLLGLAALLGGSKHGPGIAVLAFAIAAAVKLTGLPVLMLGGLAALALTFREPSREKTRTLLLAAIVGLALITPALLRGWLEHQNPLYPFGLTIAGTQVWAGNPENTLLQTGALAPARAIQFDMLEFERRLFWPSARLPPLHLNLGPAMALVVVLAVWGAFQGLRQRPHRITVSLLVLLVVVFVARLFSDSMLAHRTFAAPAVGRFLGVPAASLVLLSALAPARWFLAVGMLCIVVGILLGIPPGLGSVELPYLGLVLLVTSATLVGCILVARRLRARPLAAMLAAASILAVSTVPLDLVRGGLRDKAYEGAIDASVFDPHPTDERAARAWPIWSKLDRTDGTVVAYSAGWDGRGHHWYRHPVQGSRLQHEVVYIPVTRTGEIIDYREHERLLRAVDVGRWLARLAERDVEYFVVAAPKSVETIWTAGLPDVFELVTEAGPHRLYRVIPLALAQRLEALAPGEEAS